MPAPRLRPTFSWRLLWGLLLALALVAPLARAHAVGLSTGEYAVRGSVLRVKLGFARAEVFALLPGLDANRDGHVTALELTEGRAALDERIFGRLKVRSGGAACAGTLLDAGLTEEDGLQLEGRFDCGGSSTTIDVEMLLLADLGSGHRHAARAAYAGATHDELLSGARSTLTLPRAEGDLSPARPGVEDTAQRRPTWGLFVMGVEHILTGYDHLVFLLGVVIVRARPKQLFFVVTAFTIAHSITLAVATLGLFAPGPRFVEPAIALSIAYVGVENFVVKDGARRWRITFPFGLLHGFGFAGALRELALPRASLGPALVAFNLGVEAGQLAVMAVLLPAVMLVRARAAWFEPRGVRILSGAVAAAGVVWFVARVLGH